MGKTPFDLKTFIESLNINTGMFPIVRVDSGETPLMVVAVAKVNISPEEQKQFGDVGRDAEIPMWIMWNPADRLLQAYTNFRFGFDAFSEERLNVLIGTANHLNCFALHRIGKVFAHRDNSDGSSLFTIALTLLVPSFNIEYEEGLSTLRPIVSAHLVRLYQDSAATSVDVCDALQRAGLPVTGIPSTSSVKQH